MASLNFKLSDKEFISLIEYIISNGCYLMLDIRRPTPELICIYNLYDMKKYCSKLITYPFLILHQDYYMCPIFQIQLKDGSYIIRQRYGGPAIYLTYFTSMNNGIIDYYSYYYYDETEYNQIRPPETLVKIYRTIIKFIKSRTICINHCNRKKYCGTEYITKVLSGELDVDNEFMKSLKSQIEGSH